MFDGAQFGKLYEGSFGTVDVINGSRWLAQAIVPEKLSAVGSNYICKLFAAATYHGDGIVPVASQTFTATGVNEARVTDPNGILHTEEPKQKSDIRSAMKTLVRWWNQ